MNKIRGFEEVSSQFKRYNTEQVIMPQRSDTGSCAYDFSSPIDITISPDSQVLIWTNIKAYMLEDEMLMLNVRSSQGKPRIQLANTQGWIDSTYYSNESNDGNIGIFLRNEGTAFYEIKAGDRICQGMFTKFLITDDDSPTNNNRKGGFGSSGK
jgi:dUTP pyrophosphatase